MTIKSWNDIPAFFQICKRLLDYSTVNFRIQARFRTILSLMPKPGLLFHPDFQ